MDIKEIRDRINKKIDDDYKKRQKILDQIKKYLDIDFTKISIYTDEIIVNLSHNTHDSNNYSSNKGQEIPLFKVAVPSSIVASANYYYKGTDINTLTIRELKNLEKDLDYILKEIEIQVNGFLNV